MIELRSLDATHFEDIYAAWQDAFAGYARTWTKTELAKDLFRRGYAPELSFGAFDSNQLVGFILNGIGNINGKVTAYDTGTGIIKGHTRQGLATVMFNHSIPFLKQAGVTQYILEVLQTNMKAVSIYTKVGFRILRGLNYFTQTIGEVNLNNKKLHTSHHIEEIGFEQKHNMQTMWDFAPSWQNSFDAISRKPEDFKIFGVFEEAKLAGYGIIEPASGDIPQLAVNKQYRRQGIGSVLLKELLKHNENSSLKVINTEESYDAMTAFLESNGIPKRGSQFEMVLEFE